MPRYKAGSNGWGISHRSNESKNMAIHSHKRLTLKSPYRHKKPVIGLKQWYHTKGQTSIGDFSGPDVRGFGV